MLRVKNRLNTRTNFGALKFNKTPKTPQKPLTRSEEIDLAFKKLHRQNALYHGVALILVIAAGVYSTLYKIKESKQHQQITIESPAIQQDSTKINNK